MKVKMAILLINLQERLIVPLDDMKVGDYAVVWECKDYPELQKVAIIVKNEDGHFWATDCKRASVKGIVQKVRLMDAGDSYQVEMDSYAR
jgi:hypothetical protein